MAAQQRITRVYALRPGTIDPSVPESQRAALRAPKTQASVSLVASRSLSTATGGAYQPPVTGQPFGGGFWGGAPLITSPPSPQPQLDLAVSQFAADLAASSAKLKAMQDWSGDNRLFAGTAIGQSPSQMESPTGGGGGLTSFLGGSTTALLLLGLAAVFFATRGKG